jgi:hypothetical protein
VAPAPNTSVATADERQQGRRPEPISESPLSWVPRSQARSVTGPHGLVHRSFRAGAGCPCGDSVGGEGLIRPVGLLLVRSATRVLPALCPDRKWMLHRFRHSLSGMTRRLSRRPLEGLPPPVGLLPLLLGTKVCRVSISIVVGYAQALGDSLVAHADARAIARSLSPSSRRCSALSPISRYTGAEPASTASATTGIAGAVRILCERIH